MIGPSGNEPTADIAAPRGPLVVELLGPAGSGKTTLSRALRRRVGGIAADIDKRLSKRDKVPFVIGNTITLLPTYLRSYRHGRWFDRRETRSMAYLQAGLRLLEREGPDDGAVTLLDHGPVYRLAFLREFGPELTESLLYQRWWADLLRRWAARMDVVISLDAPSAVLMERIRTRASWHSIKDGSVREAHEALRRYREAFERTLNELQAVSPITVMRFDTSRLSTDEMVDRVVALFASLEGAGRDHTTADGGVPHESPAVSGLNGKQTASCERLT